MKLTEALVKAQQELGNVPKDAFNKHLNQGYTSSETMIELCRNALNKAGITAICFERRFSQEAGLLTSKFRLVGASDDAIEFVFDMPVLENSGMKLDKAVAAAQTYSLAYFLRDLLLAPRGESVEAREDGPAQPATTTTQPAPTPKPKPTKDVSEAQKNFITQVESFTGLVRTDKKEFPKAIAHVLSWIGYPDQKVATMDAASLTDAYEELKLRASEGKTYDDIKVPI
jgi:hypothetical protein